MQILFGADIGLELDGVDTGRARQRLSSQQDRLGEGLFKLDSGVYHVITGTKLHAYYGGGAVLDSVRAAPDLEQDRLSDGLVKGLSVGGAKYYAYPGSPFDGGESYPIVYYVGR